LSDQPVVIVNPQISTKRYLVTGFLGGAVVMHVEIKIVAIEDNPNLEGQIAQLQNDMSAWLQIGVTQVIEDES
jgi:hypothetical protein